MRKLLPSFFFSVVLLTGCSSAFNREYKSALAEPIPTDTIAGPWEGRWLSDKNGHTGKLRAVLTKTSSEEYDAYFHSTFWKIFRASYRVPLKVEGTTLSGEADLGWLSGGRYTYEGEVTPTSFFSTYKMKYDHGTFEMKRPTNAPPSRP
ncbi:MAG TPA: hypothetical protein VF773_03720 [Verrucomicrobiae bacterium]